MSKTIHQKLLAKRQDTYNLLHARTGETGGPLTAHIFISAVIVVSVLFVVLGDVYHIQNAYPRTYEAFEISFTLFFTVDYFLRIWTYPEGPLKKDERYSSGLQRMRYALFSGAGLIDLITIAPWYISVFGTLNPMIVEGLQMLRLLRILKLAEYHSTSVQLVFSVVKSKRAEIVASIVIIQLLLLVTSIFIFLAEHRAQPSIFRSVPQTVWWGASKFFGKGAIGDPITLPGKLLFFASSILSVGFFTLPAGILSGAFKDKLADRDAIRKCPLCNRAADENLHNDIIKLISADEQLRQSCLAIEYPFLTHNSLHLTDARS